MSELSHSEDFISPTPRYYETTSRGDLAWRIAQRVKDAGAQGLEKKEIRNAIESALRAELTFEFAHGRHRFVSKWMYHPVAEARS
jgi:hypothetical protein